MRRSRIKETARFGSQKLHRLVEQNLSQREIARLLGVDTKTVVGQLRKRSEIVNPGADDESLQHLEHVGGGSLSPISNPGLSRTELRRRCPAVYTWLRRNDPHWLQSHLPPVKRGPGSQRRVDWDARDQRLVALIEKAAVELTGREGKPIRLSAGAILTAAGVKGLVEKHQDKLPKTVAVLQQVQESRESFAIRRLRWSTDLLTREKGTYAEWELLRRAGVSRELASALLLPRRSPPSWTLPRRWAGMPRLLRPIMARGTRRSFHSLIKPSDDIPVGARIEADSTN